MNTILANRSISILQLFLLCVGCSPQFRMTSKVATVSEEPAAVVDEVQGAIFIVDAAQDGEFDLTVAGSVTVDFGDGSEPVLVQDETIQHVFDDSEVYEVLISDADAASANINLSSNSIIAVENLDLLTNTVALNLKSNLIESLESIPPNLVSLNISENNFDETGLNAALELIANSEVELDLLNFASQSTAAIPSGDGLSLLNQIISNGAVVYSNLASIHVNVADGETVGFYLHGSIRDINWGDGQTTANASGNNVLDFAPVVSHTYAEGGQYTIFFADNACLGFRVSSGQKVTAANGFESFGSLLQLYISDNALNEFDATRLPPSLSELWLHSNQISEIDLSALPANLTVLHLYGNNLTSVDLSQLPANLNNLRLGNNNIAEIDLSGLPNNLNTLELSSNELEEVDASVLPDSVAYLYLGSNNLVSFDTEGLPTNLQWLSLSQNPLTTFDATQLPNNLQRLEIHSAQLTSFDATQLPAALNHLNLNWNDIAAFDATQLPANLSIIGLEGNNISAFSAASLPVGLTVLNLNSNALDTSDINQILADIAALARSSVNYFLTQSNNAPPSGQGLIDKATIQGQSNNIYTD